MINLHSNSQYDKLLRDLVAFNGVRQLQDIEPVHRNALAGFLVDEQPQIAIKALESVETRTAARALARAMTMAYFSLEAVEEAVDDLAEIYFDYFHDIIKEDLACEVAQYLYDTAEDDSTDEQEEQYDDQPLNFLEN